MRIRGQIFSLKRSALMATCIPPLLGLPGCATAIGSARGAAWPEVGFIIGRVLARRSASGPSQVGFAYKVAVTWRWGLPRCKNGSAWVIGRRSRPFGNGHGQPEMPLMSSGTRFFLPVVFIPGWSAQRVHGYAGLTRLAYADRLTAAESPFGFTACTPLSADDVRRLAAAVNLYWAETHGLRQSMFRSGKPYVDLKTKNYYKFALAAYTRSRRGRHSDFRKLLAILKRDPPYPWPPPALRASLRNLRRTTYDPISERRFFWVVHCLYTTAPRGDGTIMLKSINHYISLLFKVQTSHFVRIIPEPPPKRRHGTDAG